MKDWAAVVDAGTALDGVEEGTSYGKPALTFRGKVLAATTAPDCGSFVLDVTIDEKEVLIETDPTTFGKASITTAGQQYWFATAAKRPSVSRSC